MEINTYAIHAFIEKPGMPTKIIVLALLTNLSKELRYFWLVFNWNDDQQKIMGILQKHWKIEVSKISVILNSIVQLKSDPTPSLFMTAHSFSTPKQSIQIMTDAGNGKRLILSSPSNKKFHECKPSDKRWTWISNGLDPYIDSIPVKYDLLNNLGCGVPKDRLELIEQINLFYDSIKP